MSSVQYKGLEELVGECLWIADLEGPYESVDTWVRARLIRVTELPPHDPETLIGDLGITEDPAGEWARYTPVFERVPTGTFLGVEARLFEKDEVGYPRTEDIGMTPVEFAAADISEMLFYRLVPKDKSHSSASTSSPSASA